jgi:hypothetical protein
MHRDIPNEPDTIQTSKSRREEGTCAFEIQASQREIKQISRRRQRLLHQIGTSSLFLRGSFLLPISFSSLAFNHWLVFVGLERNKHFLHIRQLVVDRRQVNFVIDSDIRES